VLKNLFDGRTLVDEANNWTPENVEAMRDGRVDCTASSPTFTQELEKMGCTLLLNPRKLFPRGKPKSVITARNAVIEERGQELRAILRSILRAFWLVRDQPESLSYVADLEKRLRSAGT
jgi:ABC-type nitrate/sulfonate/bicarbonate transport system substrate-binding protein